MTTPTQPPEFKKPVSREKLVAQVARNTFTAYLAGYATLAALLDDAATHFGLTEAERASVAAAITALVAAQADEPEPVPAPARTPAELAAIAARGEPATDEQAAGEGRDGREAGG